MNKLILIILLLGSVVFFQACKDDVIVDPPPVSSGYFPNGDGTFYRYSVTTTDSAGGQEQGTRSSVYSGTQVRGEFNYQVQYDTLTLGAQTSASVSYFRKIESGNTAGVYFFLDTTGLAANIPDTIRQYLTIDSEVLALPLPLGEGSAWTAFKLNLNYGPISFRPVEVKGNYAGSENVTLNLTSGVQTKTAVKVRYELNLKFDFALPVRTYEAFCWTVDGIGIVKWEGTATIINGISSGGIDFADTTKTVSQSLIDYSIK